MGKTARDQELCSMRKKKGEDNIDVSLELTVKIMLWRFSPLASQLSPSLEK